MDIRRFFGGGNAAASKGTPTTKTTKKSPAPSKASLSTKAKKKEAKTPTKPSAVVVIESDSEDTPIKVNHGDNHYSKRNEKAKTEAKVIKAVTLPTPETSPSEKENKATKDKEPEKGEAKKRANKRENSEDRTVEKCKKDQPQNDKAETSEKEKGKGSKAENVNGGNAEKCKIEEKNEEEAKGKEENEVEREPVNGKHEIAEEHTIEKSKEDIPSKQRNEEERKPAKSKKEKAKESKAAKSKRDKFGDSREVTSKHERDEAAKTKKEKKQREQSEERKTGKRKSVMIVVSSDEDEAFSAKHKARRSSKGKKGTIIFDSDSDEELIPPTQESKKSRKKAHTNFVSDSDEEDRQVSIIDAFKKVTKKQTPKKTPKSVEKPKKMCTMADFFGQSTPVHRVERKVLPVKRKIDDSPTRTDVVTIDDDDMEIHDDDDFERTLLLLDTSQGDQQQTKKPKLDPSTAPSLASKLSSRLKNETRVEQMPERKKSHLSSEMGVIEETPKRNKSPSKNSFKTSSIRKSPVRTSPRKRSPVKMSPLKMSPTKMSPLKMSPTPTKAINSPKRAMPKDSTGQTPDTDTGTPKGGRGGPDYRSYLNRAPPQALGSKEIPEGAPNCLEGLTFVISGVLESLERDDAKSLVERYGGKVTTSISKRTNYIVLGRDAGVSKTAKAEQFGTKQLDEDGLLDLIRSAKGKKSKYEIKAEADAAKEKKQQSTPKADQKSISKTITPQPSPAAMRPSPSPAAVRPSPSPAAVRPLPSTTTVRPSPSTAQSSPATTRPSSVMSSPVASSPRMKSSEASLMWVDKYKPASLKQVIGQQGPKSNANKLLNWLRNWHRWQAEGRKPAFNNRFSDDGAGYRAALLSGPPGVGKTTTSTLVCQEVGFSYVELNASDTRSKKSLETEVSELLGNHTLVDFFGTELRGGSTHSKTAEGKMHCLIMDEVDGMAGNEDRGGMQELIALIKKSRIPIICMCNDRNHQKVRSLANYCFDLRFQCPRVEQIKAAMMSISYKEGVKIPPAALNEVIAAANQDVRQVIHNLSMWTAVEKVVSYDQIKEDAAKAVKDMKMGPFDVCRKVFVGGVETAKMSIHDKSDLFFHDYSFGPLFVHENYILATPYAARGNNRKHLQCLSRAIDSIADGDLVDRQIRGNQNWSLLPLQAMYSSVIPGEAMRGSLGQMVQFPQWLGKNSSRTKTDRILQELHTHMSLKLSGDRRALNMDYIPHFRRRLTRPLVDQGNEGVPEVISTLHMYDLLKEDYDNILDISQWSHLREPLIGVDPKTKAAFTRTYNKEAHLTPYAAVVTAKKGRGRTATAGADTELMGEEDAAAMAVDEADSDEDVEIFKAKKKPTRKGAAASGDSAKGKGRGKATGRERGRGRGKGK